MQDTETAKDRHFSREIRLARLKVFISAAVAIVTIVGVVSSEIWVFATTTQRFEDQLVAVQTAQMQDRRSEDQFRAETISAIGTVHADVQSLDDRVEQRFDALSKQIGK